MKSCTVLGCRETRIARGLCSKHYQRFKKYGSLESPHGRAERVSLRTIQDARDYLVTSCIPQPNGCWEWRYATNGSGYGTKQFNEEKLGAHELAYRAFVDCDWKSGRDTPICHKCNNRKCINPRHLYAGTPSENRWDALKAGTHNTQKIPLEEVLKIRELFQVKQPRGAKKALAAKWGVDRHTIRNIIAGTTWSHL